MRTPTMTEFVNRMKIDPGLHNETNMTNTYLALIDALQWTETAMQTLEDLNEERGHDDGTPLDRIINRTEEILNDLHTAHEGLEWALEYKPVGE